MSEAEPTRLESLAFARNAARLIHEGDISGARDLLSEGTGRHDSYPAGFQILGDLFSREGDTEHAIEMYNRALALDPQNPRLLLSLGRLTLAEHPEHAQDLFWRALRYEPGVPELESALRDAIGAMESPAGEEDPDGADDDAVVISTTGDEDAFDALAGQPESDNTTETAVAEPDTPDTIDIPLDETTAELDIVELEDAEAEPPREPEPETDAPSAETDESISRNDDDLDLSEMTKAALADLDHPVHPKPSPEDTDDLSDIAGFASNSIVPPATDLGFAQVSDTELDMPEVSAQETEAPETDKIDEDLSMFAPDTDIEPDTVMVIHEEEQSLPDITEMADEQSAETDGDIAAEEPVPANQETLIPEPTTTDEPPDATEPPEEPETDGAIDDILSGFEQDESDLTFLVGGNQQAQEVDETTAEDIGEESPPEEDRIASDEEPREPEVSDEPTDDELIALDIMEPESPGVEDSEVFSGLEPERSSTDTDTVADISAILSDTIDIGPEPRSDEVSAIESETQPEEPVDIELDVLWEESPEVSDDLESDIPTGILGDTDVEEPDDLTIDIAAEEPEETSVMEETVDEDHSLPMETDIEPADIAPAAEMPIIEPESGAIKDTTETTGAVPQTDYSALLAGMDLSTIEEEENGMTGGILELDEEDLSGLAFDESTPESVEEPVISEEERAELSALDRFIDEDENASTSDDVSFEDAGTGEPPADDQPISDADAGIDYSDILFGDSGSGDSTPDTDTATESPHTESGNDRFPEAGDGFESGYEEMLAEIANGSGEDQPSTIDWTMTEDTAENVETGAGSTDIELVSAEPETEPAEPESDDQNGQDETPDSGTVEELMKGTMSIRLDLSGEETASVDESSLDSLISDYMSALSTYEEPAPKSAPTTIDEPDAMAAPAPAEPLDTGQKQPLHTDSAGYTGMEDIRAEEFGDSLDEPVGPEETTATMAEIFAKQGLLSRAIDIYTRILSHTPDDEKARNRLAELNRLRDEAPDGR